MVHWTEYNQQIIAQYKDTLKRYKANLLTYGTEKWMNHF